MGTPAKIKQRTHRERQRDGKICLTIVVEQVPLTESLIAAGFLSPTQEDDREAIGEALARVVEVWTVTSNDTV
jgi:hypothetical protein